MQPSRRCDPTAPGSLPIVRSAATNWGARISFLSPPDNDAAMPGQPRHAGEGRKLGASAQGRKPKPQSTAQAKAQAPAVSLLAFSNFYSRRCARAHRLQPRPFLCDGLKRLDQPAVQPHAGFSVCDIEWVSTAACKCRKTLRNLPLCSKTRQLTAGRSTWLRIFSALEPRAKQNCSFVALEESLIPPAPNLICN